MTVLTVGDPVPWFTLPSTSNPKFHFDTVGGYRVILFFFGSSKHSNSARILQDFSQRQTELVALKSPFFGVSVDPDDTSLSKLIENPTYFKFLWDFESEISRKYGVYQVNQASVIYSPTTFVLDETLRVLRVFPVEAEHPEQHVEQVLCFLRDLPSRNAHHPAQRQAPVLLIPRVFDRAFCEHLIHLFEADGGEESGFMREKEGKTIAVHDYSFKRRRDFNLEQAESGVLQTVNELVLRRVKPEIEKAFQFSITRFERHVIACYEAEHGGFFNRHRDNTTKGTAHRRFAMTLNLNTDEYEGGCLWFPEYGAQLYSPQVGEAVVFSCSLLHEVTPVTKGKRYAVLSFFYDDHAAKIREQNRKYLTLEESRANEKQAANQ
jgi:peroxiredoxin/predicted 2-oxoglutarate/Fe(II)-dependent dioxygenase YbiX